MRNELVAVALFGIAIGGLAFGSGEESLTIAKPIDVQNWDAFPVLSADKPAETEVQKPAESKKLETPVKTAKPATPPGWNCENGVCRRILSTEYTPTGFNDGVTPAQTGTVQRATQRKGVLSRLRSFFGNRGSRKCRCN